MVANIIVMGFVGEFDLVITCKQVTCLDLLDFSFIILHCYLKTTIVNFMFSPRSTSIEHGFVGYLQFFFLG